LIPQTSDGLLFGLQQKNKQLMQEEAARLGVVLWKIGELTNSGIIEIR
jgi:selenophosphate synthase